VTIFLGCGFAAKYREGGGNFSVPLQWMLGLQRLKLDAIWFELLLGTDYLLADQSRITNFERQLQAMDWHAGIVSFIKRKAVGQIMQKKLKKFRPLAGLETICSRRVMELVPRKSSTLRSKSTGAESSVHTSPNIKSRLFIRETAQPEKSL